MTVGEFKCTWSNCHKSYNKRCRLEEHLRSHTGERPFVCSTCKRSFTRQTHLKNHMVIHSDERPFTCSHCGKGFKLKHQLTVHEQHHISSQPYTCNICSLTFSKHKTLTEHKNQVHGVLPVRKDRIKSYVCTFCPVENIEQSNNIFSTWSSFVKHKKEVHPKSEKSYTCPICLKVYVGYKNYAHHKRIHNVDREKLNCEYCEKTFMTTSSLNTHIKAKHLQLKPIVCDLCGIGFAYKNVLNNHIKAHENEKTDNEKAITEQIIQNVFEPSTFVGLEYDLSCSGNCGRKFKRQYDQERHVCRHDGSNREIEVC